MFTKKRKVCYETDKPEMDLYPPMFPFLRILLNHYSQEGRYAHRRVILKKLLGSGRVNFHHMFSRLVEHNLSFSTHDFRMAYFHVSRYNDIEKVLGRMHRSKRQALQDYLTRLDFAAVQEKQNLTMLECITYLLIQRYLNCGGVSFCRTFKWFQNAYPEISYEELALLYIHAGFIVCALLSGHERFLIDRKWLVEAEF